MLTLFTIPKAFRGQIDIIQRNAIKSWTLLEPKCQVILVGDDEGTDKVAEELGVMHIPGVKCNDFGTPLLNHSFQLAETEANFPLMCHVNADIILMSDFIEAVQRVKELSKRFLMTAQRRDLDITDLLGFGNGWQDKLISDVVDKGRLHHFTGIDFWAYTKGLVDNMPPFAVGRIATESWLMYKARMMGADLIDATGVVVSVHQNHDYSHHPDGVLGIGTGIEAQRNRELVGGKPYFFIIKDRTHILSQDGLKQARDAWWLWRSLRTAQVLPLSAPLPVRMAVKALNISINAGRDLCLRMGVKRLKR